MEVINGKTQLGESALTTREKLIIFSQTGVAVGGQHLKFGVPLRRASRMCCSCLLEKPACACHSGN